MKMKKVIFCRFCSTKTSTNFWKDSADERSIVTDLSFWDILALVKIKKMSW